MRNLLTEPACNSEDLGIPLPDSLHAVSVAMPLWEDVVSYEEGATEILDKLSCGYPRFVMHPLVNALNTKLLKDCGGGFEHCCVFPSLFTAARACDYLRRHGRGEFRLAGDKGTGAFPVFASESDYEILKEYWQHGGEIVSSRMAKSILNGVRPDCSENVSKFQLKQLIAEHTRQNPEDVYLFPSGMSAIFMALRVLLRYCPEGAPLQLGFPYVDTLKLFERWAEGAVFVQNESDLLELRKQLSSNSVCGVFAEVPSNPLLHTLDVDRIYGELSKRKIPFILDDTVGTFYNLNLKGKCDLLCSSLTKFFSGAGDVMGGSLVLDSSSQFYSECKQLLDKEYEDLLWNEDADILIANARDFASRMKRINYSAEKLCAYLDSRPEIAKVYYPMFVNCDNYDTIKSGSGGYGGLFSMLFKKAELRTKKFFDSLKVSKGPSLGTDFTLACPYTLLAHYYELPWAESCGVSPFLVRVSVGLEDTEELISRFEKALNIIAKD